MKPGDGLLHTAPLVALATLIVNDHWGKAAYPGWVTGKLSDVAGLVFFPLFLEAVVELIGAKLRRFERPSRKNLLFAIAATAIVFALAKTWPVFNAEVRLADAAIRYPARLAQALWNRKAAPPLGRPSLVLDPTDLFALPAFLVGWIVGNARRRSDGRPQWSSVVQASST